VYNYASGLFYKYQLPEVTAAAEILGEMYLGTANGKLLRFGDEYLTDDGAPILASWESGQLAFERDWLKKHTGWLWLTVKGNGAESGLTQLQLKFMDGNGQESKTKTVEWFGAEAERTRRVRVKLRKFESGKLMFNTLNGSVTVLAAELEVGYNGRVNSNE